jgi:hypothetical protein
VGSTAVIGLWRDDPDIIGQVGRDFLEDIESRGFNAIIVGNEDAHAGES